MMYELIVFLPLLGFLIAGLFGRQIGDRASELVTTGLLGVSRVPVLDRLLHGRRSARRPMHMSPIAQLVHLRQACGRLGRCASTR